MYSLTVVPLFCFLFLENICTETRPQLPRDLTMRIVKFRWMNYFLVLTLFNVILHISYLVILLGAHDSLDQTATNIYSFEQVDVEVR